MKRKLSLLMVLMMVLTLIPAMPSFANSTTSGRIEVSGYRNDLTLGSKTGEPKLVFDNSPLITGGATDTRPITTITTFTIKLTEGNARFITELPVGTPVYPTVGNPVVTRTGDTTISVTYAPPAYDATKENESFIVPFFIEATGTGDIKAKVDERLNGFKDINVLRTIASIQKSASTIIVDKVGNISRNNSIVETSTSEARMRIVENINTAWQSATQKIEIRLDGSDFTFGTTVVKLDGDVLTLGTHYEFLDGGKTLRLLPNVIATHAKYSTSFRNELVIDAPIRVKRGTEIGKDVTATVRGEISPTSITVAKYTDYAIEIKADKVLDVIAGQDVPGRYVAKLTIEEMIPGSLLDGRVLEVSLPSAGAYQYDETIKLDKLKGTGDINIAPVGLSKPTETSKPEKFALVNIDFTANRVMEIEINRGSNIPDNGGPTDAKPNNLAAKYELFVPFVVATNYTGDLELTFKGAGITEQKVKIATVKAPVTVEVTKKGDLNIGEQNQTAPDVLIKETVAGALLEFDVVRDSGATYKGTDGAYNAYGLVDQDYDVAGVTNWGAAITAGTVETTAKLDDNWYDKTLHKFALVSRSKDKPFEFLLTGQKITLDRTVPYGDFFVGIDAGNVKARHNLTDIIETKVFFNVATPHPTDQNLNTIFTIGENTYVQKISGLDQSIEMEVAPQIINNRTMMPIRYVADALNAKVNYDVATRTAIFSKDAISVSMTLDSNIMYVNGSPVVMDTPPVVQNERALVALVNIAQAFGLNSATAPATADIVWDADAKTVTLFPIVVAE